MAYFLDFYYAKVAEGETFLIFALKYEEFELKPKIKVQNSQNWSKNLNIRQLKMKIKVFSLDDWN